MPGPCFGQHCTYIHCEFLPTSILYASVSEYFLSLIKIYSVEKAEKVTLKLQQLLNWSRSLADRTADQSHQLIS